MYVIETILRDRLGPVHHVWPGHVHDELIKNSHLNGTSHKHQTTLHHNKDWYAFNTQLI